MKKERGSATLVLVCSIFVITCALFFYIALTQAGNDFLMNILGSMQTDQSPTPKQQSDLDVVPAGKKITRPNGTLGCKEDSLVCPDGRVQKRVFPDCTFPRCP